MKTIACIYTVIGWSGQVSREKQESYHKVRRFTSSSLIFSVKDKRWTKRTKFNCLEYLYTGEVDKNGKLCGYGVATRIDAPHIKLEGTFYKNREHGLGKSLSTKEYA